MNNGIKQAARAFFSIRERTQIFIRALFLRMLVGSVGGGIRLYGWPRLYFPENIIIGDNVTINHGVLLNGRAGLRIGNNVRISPYVIIETGFLKPGKKVKDHSGKEIVIGDGAWIASGAIVLAGVSVGAGALAPARWWRRVQWSRGMCRPTLLPKAFRLHGIKTIPRQVSSHPLAQRLPAFNAGDAAGRRSINSTP